MMVKDFHTETFSNSLTQSETLNSDGMLLNEESCYSHHIYFGTSDIVPRPWLCFSHRKRLIKHSSKLPLVSVFTVFPPKPPHIEARTFIGWNPRLLSRNVCWSAVWLQCLHVATRWKHWSVWAVSLTMTRPAPTVCRYLPPNTTF